MAMNGRLLRPRASGFDPRTIANLGLWLDASDTPSLTLNANTVSEWRDKSGNGRHFAQATAASQPNAVNRTQNGRRVLDFELSQELTGNAASLNILRNVSGATITMAARWDVLATASLGRVVLLVSTGSASTAARASVGAIAPSTTTVGLGGRRLDANAFAGVNAAYAAGTDVVLTGIWDYANSDAFVFLGGTQAAQNLSFQTDGNTSDTSSLSFIVGSVGGGSYFDGWIGEILVWPRVLLASERLTAERYLGRKWGIAVA